MVDIITIIRKLQANYYMTQKIVVSKHSEWENKVILNQADRNRMIDIHRVQKKVLRIYLIPTF